MRVQQVSKRRNVTSFDRLEHYRGVAARCDKRGDHYRAPVVIAMLWIP
ncbi:hypothetical protein [Carbonactinospora thermoautotrophica]|nr:hypothetical protein [Carbonactinospora thermoautotrophica]